MSALVQFFVDSASPRRRFGFASAVCLVEPQGTARGTCSVSALVLFFVDSALRRHHFGFAGMA